MSDRVRDLSDAAARLVGTLRGLAEKRPTGPDERKLATVHDELDGIVGILAAARRDGLRQRDAVYAARRADAQEILEERSRRLRAYAVRERVVVPAEGGKFIVAGRVTDRATGVGLPHVVVRAFDLDRKFDDRLGSTRTDALGYFRIEYTTEDIDDPDQLPETFIEVLDPEGKVLFASPKSFIQKTGRTAFIDVPIEGSRVPASARLASKLQTSIDHRLAGLDRRTRLAAVGSAFATRDVPISEAGRQPGRERPTAPGRHAVAEIKGVGRAYSDRLGAAGISDAAAIADMKPVALERILGVTEAKAKQIIQSARRLTRER